MDRTSTRSSDWGRESVEVVHLILQEHISESIFEPMIGILIPQTGDEIVEVVRIAPVHLKTQALSPRRAQTATRLHSLRGVLDAADGDETAGIDKSRGRREAVLGVRGE